MVLESSLWGATLVVENMRPSLAIVVVFLFDDVTALPLSSLTGSVGIGSWRWCGLPSWEGSEAADPSADPAECTLGPGDFDSVAAAGAFMIA